MVTGPPRAAEFGAFAIMHKSKTLTVVATAATAIALAADARAAAAPTVTTWRGTADLSSGIPAFAGEGSGDWLSWAAAPYTYANPSTGYPWTAGLPQDNAVDTFHAVIGTSRPGVAPTRTYEVGLWSPRDNPYTVPGNLTISGLTVGTDYVLHVQNNRPPSLTVPRTLVLTAGATFVNDGVIRLDGDQVNPVNLRLTGPTTIAGQGTIELGDGVRDSLYDSPPRGNISVVGVGSTLRPQLTIGAGQTITGNGGIAALVRNDGTIRSSQGYTSYDRPGYTSSLNISIGPTGDVGGPPGTAVNAGTLLAENGGRIQVTLGTGSSFRNDGVLEANGVDATGVPSRLVLQRGANITTTFQFPDGHKPRAVNGGIVEARGWTLSAADIDFVGGGNTLAVADGGTLANADSSLNLSSGLSVEIGGGGTLVGGTLDNTAPGAGAIIVANDGGTATMQDVAINGTVTVGDTATLALAGVVKGNFTATGDVAVQGTLSPGNSPGVVNAAGDATLAASSDLAMELAGTSPTRYDQFNATGQLTIAGGRLDVTLLDGFIPSPGDRFDLFDFAASSGTFSTINLPSLASGQSWDTSSLYTNGELTVVPEPATFAVLTLAAALPLARRRRRS